MAVRIVAGILAIVFLSLGIVFLILGLATDTPDADGFRATGGAIFAAGIVAATIFTLLHRRGAAERRRRQQGARAYAEIVEARLHQYTRVGVMLTYTLTIRYPDAGLGESSFTRTVLVPPTLALKTGERVEVQYDPADPGNFEPVA